MKRGSIRPRALPAPVGTLVVLLAVGGCTDPDEPQPVAVPVELSTTWDLFPHRLSHQELTYSTRQSSSGGVVEARLDGGGWGAIDIPRVRYGIELWRSSTLRAEEASIEIEIPPGAEDDGEPFAVASEVTFPAAALEGVGSAVAFIRGFAITTDRYETPPPFETDPELPYDPVEGYTSQGVAITLGEVRLAAGEAAVPVRVRNSLGLADRPDMNAAMEQASTWVRVDLLVVGTTRGPAPVTGEATYFVGAAEYGADTVHEHASEGEQTISLDGEPGAAAALFGLRSIEFWLNLEGRHDPECAVVQDEINSWDEPVSGPGRYVRELSARLWGATYDEAAGSGQVRADLFLSNSSSFKEVGNLCLGVRSEVSMLQVDDGDATATTLPAAELRLHHGESSSLEVEY